MTDLAKKLREAIDMDAATATDAEWSNLLATAMDVRDALEREPDEAMVERVARAIYDQDDVSSYSWDDLPGNDQVSEAYRDAARAAIAAMKGGRA